MSDPRCSGSHTEIQAMSEMYNRRIDVYSFDLGACVYRWISSPSPLLCKKKKPTFSLLSMSHALALVAIEPINTFQGHLMQDAPIRLAFYYSHYDAIHDPAQPSFGVGIGATTAAVRFHRRAVTSGLCTGQGGRSPAIRTPIFQTSFSCVTAPHSNRSRSSWSGPRRNLLKR